MSNDDKKSSKDKQIADFFKRHTEQIREEFNNDYELKKLFKKYEIASHYTKLIEEYKPLLDLQFDFKKLENQLTVDTIMNLHDIWIWLFDESHNVLYYPFPKYNFGNLVNEDFKSAYFESFLKDWSLRPGQGTAGFAMETEQGVCIPNTFVDVRGSVAIEDLLLRNMSYINVPVFSDAEQSGSENLIAVVCLVFPVQGAWKCTSDQCGFSFKGEKSRNNPCIYNLFYEFVKKIEIRIQEFWELVREMSIKEKYHKLIELGEEGALQEVYEKNWWNKFFKAFLSHKEYLPIRDFIGVTAWSLSLFDQAGDIITFNDIVDKKVFLENYISSIKNLTRLSPDKEPSKQSLEEPSTWNCWKPVFSEDSGRYKLLGIKDPDEKGILNPEVDMEIIRFGEPDSHTGNILQFIFDKPENAERFRKNQKIKELQKQLGKIAEFWSEESLINRLEENYLFKDNDIINRRILRFKLISGIKDLLSKFLTESFLLEKPQRMGQNMKILEFFFKILGNCGYAESKTNEINECFRSISECLKDYSIMAVSHWTNHESLRHNLSEGYPERWYVIESVVYIWSDENAEDQEKIEAWINKELSSPETQRVYETIINIVANRKEGYFAEINSSASSTADESIVSGLTEHSLETKISSNIYWRKENLGEYSPLKKLFAIKPENSEHAYLLIAECINNEELVEGLKALKTDVDIWAFFVENNYGKFAVIVRWRPEELSEQLYLSSCYEKELWLTSILLEGLNEEVTTSASNLKQCFIECAERTECEGEEEKYIPTYYYEGNDWQLHDIYKLKNNSECKACSKGEDIYKYIRKLTSKGIGEKYGFNTVSLFPININVEDKNEIAGIAGFWGSHIDANASKGNLLETERNNLLKGAIDYAENQLTIDVQRNKEKQAKMLLAITAHDINRHVLPLANTEETRKYLKDKLDYFSIITKQIEPEIIESCKTLDVLNEFKTIGLGIGIDWEKVNIEGSNEVFFTIKIVLFSIFENLVVNSYRHGGKRKETEVTIKARKNDDKININYSDTGDGFSKEALNNLKSWARGNLTDEEFKSDKGTGIFAIQKAIDILKAEIVWPNKIGDTNIVIKLSALTWEDFYTLKSERRKAKPDGLTLR